MKVLKLSLGLFSACAATTAHAGAWTQPEGTGQIIATGIYSHSGKGYDREGHVIDIADYTKAEIYLLTEYGVTDDLTLMVTPSFSHVDIDGGNASTGAGYTELGGRYRLVQEGNAVFSLQGSFRIPGKKRRDSLAQIGSTDSEIDLRALAGTSFKIGGKDGYVDLQAGYRIRNSAPPNEFRFDATVGVRPTKTLLLLVQSFNVISDGAGRGIFDRYRYHNLYAGGIYDLGSSWSIQLGGLMTLGGENALRERGFYSGLSYRF